VVNLSSALYVKGSKDPLWKAEISVTDPQYVDQAAVDIARNMFSHWQSDNILKPKAK